MARTNVDILLEDLARLDDGQGPAENIGSAQAEALVLGAMRRSGIISVEPRAGNRRWGKVVWLRRNAVLGVGVLAVTTAAAALVAGVGRESLAHWAGSAQPAQHAKASRGPSVPAAKSADVREQPVALTASAATEPEKAGPLGESARKPEPPRVSSAPRRNGPAEVLRSAAQAAPVHVTTAAPDPAPAVDVLARANQYRRQRQYGRALRAYLDVVERHPNTRQADAARIAAADLRLEHLADAKGAAEEYMAAASGRGQLGEEAAYGLVEAHRAAGKHDLERMELERFIVRYPASPLAATVRRRLEQLRYHGR